MQYQVIYCCTIKNGSKIQKVQWKQWIVSFLHCQQRRFEVSRRRQFPLAQILWAELEAGIEGRARGCVDVASKSHAHHRADSKQWWAHFSVLLRLSLSSAEEVCPPLQVSVLERRCTSLELEWPRYGLPHVYPMSLHIGMYYKVFIRWCKQHVLMYNMKMFPTLFLSVWQGEREQCMQWRSSTLPLITTPVCSSLIPASGSRGTLICWHGQRSSHQGTLWCTSVVWYRGSCCQSDIVESACVCVHCLSISSSLSNPVH